MFNVDPTGELAAQNEEQDRRLADFEAIQVPHYAYTSFVVTNSSGVTVAPGDVGFVDANGDYTETTTANDVGAWVVVTSGADDTEDISVTSRGRVNINYTGGAPSDGDFLTTSATAGAAQASTTMRPEIFARALAAGSGGVVQALLLTERKHITPSLLSDPVAVWLNNVATFDSAGWSGTVNDVAPTTSPVTVATGTGNINTITPQSANQSFKIVMRNVTRSVDALIDSVAGNNVTFVDDAALATWVNGDTLTCISSDVTILGNDFMDVSVNQELHGLVTSVDMVALYNSATVANQLWLMPQLSGATAADLQILTSISAAATSGLRFRVGLYEDGRFSMTWRATANSGFIQLYCAGYTIASP